jgi:phosphinothricin acetyltransferase
MVTSVTPDSEGCEVGNVTVVFVRDAAMSDLPEITAIYNALLETTTHEWTEIAHTVAEREEWLSAQTASRRPALVAVDAAEVVGWATYGDFRDSERWPGYRFSVEHSIHVREDHWGRGVGRTLINALIERARSAGKHVMVAGIDADNTGSIRFHERLGFVEVGRMPEIGEKFGRRLDLVLMQLVLDDRPA